MSIRTDVTRSLAPALRSRLPQAEISDTTAVADELNQKNALPLFEQMVQTYENTGVYDKQKIAMLGQMLNANYLLVSRLKAEKMDLLISQGTGGSLDLSLIEVQTAQVAWAGSGEWKRGGVLGFGGATSQEVASGLVEKALAGLL